QDLLMNSGSKVRVVWVGTEVFQRKDGNRITKRLWAETRRRLWRTRPQRIVRRRRLRGSLVARSWLSSGRHGERRRICDPDRGRWTRCLWTRRAQVIPPTQNEGDWETDHEDEHHQRGDPGREVQRRDEDRRSLDQPRANDCIADSNFDDAALL